MWHDKCTSLYDGMINEAISILKLTTDDHAASESPLLYAVNCRYQTQSLDDSTPARMLTEMGAVHHNYGPSSQSSLPCAIRQNSGTVTPGLQTTLSVLCSLTSHDRSPSSL